MSIKIKRSHTRCAYIGYYIDNLKHRLTDEQVGCIKNLNGIQSVQRLSWEPTRIEFFIKPQMVAEAIIDKVLKTLTPHE